MTFLDKIPNGLKDMEPQGHAAAQVSERLHDSQQEGTVSHGPQVYECDKGRTEIFNPGHLLVISLFNERDELFLEILVEIDIKSSVLDVIF